MRIRTAAYMEKNAIRRFFSKNDEGYGFGIKEGFMHELEAHVDARELAGIRFDDVCQNVICNSRLTMMFRSGQGICCHPKKVFAYKFKPEALKHRGRQITSASRQDVGRNYDEKYSSVRQ